MAIDPEARRVALALLSQGQISVAEATALAGVSPQLMAYWVKQGGVQWRRVRTARTTRLWRKEMHRGPKLVEKQSPPSGK